MTRHKAPNADANLDASIVETVHDMHTPQDGFSAGWASAEDVALALNVSRTTARRHLNALVTSGALVTNMPFGRPTGPSPRMYHVATVEA
jgi:response regulator of citrate/malate metabolism